MPTTFRASRSMRRMLALPVVLGASVAALCAQTSAPVSATPATQSSEAATGSTYNLQLPAHLDLPAYSSSSNSSSSTDSSASSGQVVAANTADHFSFLNAQYGRQRYGRPRYRGGNTNEDGSEKYTFFAGAGFGQPVGNTYHYFTPNYGFQVGGGRNFNKHFGTMIQFDYDHFDLNQRTLGNQSYIYTDGTDANPADNGIDASNHVWSFSIDPTYTFYSGEGLGAYVVAGVGFYHKVTDFTAPQEGFECYGGFCEDVEYQGTFDHYTSNAVGFNGGFGLTYKFSRFSNERLYAEARYVFIDNSQRYGYTVANLATTTYNGYNAFPANSNRTTYVPIKVGIRF